MNYHTLGRTGLKVSEIALGTVSLGADYGLPAPGEFGRPGRSDALRVIQMAADAGINLFDTAPAYGDAEALLGDALAARNDCFIATKVSVPQNGIRSISETIPASLEKSLRSLKRDAVDIVQVHNATTDVIEAGAILEALIDAKTAGKIRFVGVSVYTDAEAIAAIQSGTVDMIQIAFSILDQRKMHAVIPEAKKHNIGVLSRSALLKGALSLKALHLPTELEALKVAASRVRDVLNVSWEELPSAAVRFCVDANGIDSVLIGPRTLTELEQALHVVSLPKLNEIVMTDLQKLGLTDERLVNPALWPIK